jgi:hypothetical protein
MKRPAACLALALGLALPAAAAAGSGVAPVFMNCASLSPTQLPAPWVPAQRPAACNLTGEPLNEGDLAIVRHAQWSGWGTGSATASGQALDPHPDPGVPAAVAVRIELSHVQRGCRGRLYYTRARVTTRYGTGTTDLSASCDQTMPSLGTIVVFAAG